MKSFCVRHWLAPGARSKFGAPTFEREVFRKQMHCTEVLVTLLELFGALIVIRLPGNCAPWPPTLRSWLLHTGTLGFRRGKIFQFARIFAPLWWKRMGEFCRAMVLLTKLAQTYREVFPQFFTSCANLPLTSYAYSSNAETLAKYQLSSA